MYSMPERKHFSVMNSGFMYDRALDEKLGVKLIISTRKHKKVVIQKNQT